MGFVQVENQVNSVIIASMRLIGQIQRTDFTRRGLTFQNKMPKTQADERHC